MTAPSLTQLLSIDIPLIQAPMAGAQGSALAIAVCNAGALGSLPGAMLDAATLRNEIKAIQARTRKPFNVNFFSHETPPPDAERESAWRQSLAPYYAELGIDPAGIAAGPGRNPFSDEVADVLEPLAPPVVSFHFGLPRPELVARVRRWGAKVISSATTVEEGLWLQAHGVDAVIAQGLEAGGHRGIFLSDDLTTQMGTFPLVRQLAQVLTVPVIAAGGISDAQSVAAAMALGAAGVQPGTAFLLCPESTTSAVHRAALASPQARHTALTNLFTGRPARGVVNRFMRENGPLSPKAPAFPLATGAVAPLRTAAEKAGSGDFSPLWSGQNCSDTRALPAAERVALLAQGFGGRR